MADYLLNEQAHISVYDPKVEAKSMYADLNYLDTRADEENRVGLKASENSYEACKEAHAIAVLTEWDEFKDYDWQSIYDNMKKPAFVFDGRNILDGDKLRRIGFVYQSIGK